MNKKIKKFTLFDWIVTAIVVLAIGAGCFYLYKTQNKGEKCEVTFTVEFKWVDEGFVKSVEGAPERGDEIKDSIKGYYLGKAVGVSVENDKVINFDEKTMKFVEVESPGKYTVYLTVKGNGVDTDSAILCEGQPVMVGAKMGLKGKGFAQSGFVTELKITKEGAEND